MSWILLPTIALALALAFVGLLLRRQEIARLSRTVGERRIARERGSDRARLQHPFIDLTRCIGCGICVNACPEEQVLDLLHGQAVIVHGSRCVGHGRCAEACPVGAIALTLGDISERTDLPAVTESLEAIGTPGLFLAGEVTGYALIRTAITHGVSVADAVAQRVRSARGPASLSSPSGNGALTPVHDLAIVGAGPAGIACALRAKEHQLDAYTIDQESLGGTVARYPRQKLVMTQPVTLPVYGRLKNTTFVKEELIELWHDVARQAELPIRTGVTYHGLSHGDGLFTLDTSDGPIHARNVVLALGRRGSPRKLGVPGEERSKVSYSLLDAHSYHDRRVLVVGGGDSAIEAAIGLSEQPGNQVTLSYRKGAFSRLKTANERRLFAAVEGGGLDVIFNSEVARIDEKFVAITVRRENTTTEHTLPNDDVFIFAGGVAPFRLLEESGVSFAPEDRLPVASIDERGPGLLVAVTTALICAIAVGTWAWSERAYYQLDLAGRSAHPAHDLLRAAGVVGLGAGIVAVAAMVWNLSYLVRRARWGQWIPGSLSFWMSSHVLTGVVALLTVLLHSGFSTRSSVGGYAFICMSVVVAAGAVGRYLYSFVPRAANGRELDLDEARSELDQLSLEWEERGSRFGQRAKATVDRLVTHERWRGSFFGRVTALVSGQRHLERELAQLRNDGQAEGVTPEEVRRWLDLARRAYRSSFAVAHYEDLRAILGTWRYLHRWLALLLVLFVGAHIVTALRYAELGPAPTPAQPEAPLDPATAAGSGG